MNFLTLPVLIFLGIAAVVVLFAGLVFSWKAAGIAALVFIITVLCALAWVLSKVEWP